MKERNLKNYYLGKSNVIAYSFLLTTIVLPGRLVNPLYIYGDSGVGKTHLMRAVQHAYNYLIPTKRAVYITARELCDELVKSILNGEACKMVENIYREADILMIDDLQYIADKNATQVEMSQVFLELCDRNRQVILACDRPLKEFPALYARMYARFGELREVELHIPDRKLRRKLIRKKVKAMGLTISDETAAYILENAFISPQIDGLLNELELRRKMNGRCSKHGEENHTSGHTHKAQNSASHFK